MGGGSKKEKEQEEEAVIDDGSRTKLVLLDYQRKLKLQSVCQVADWAPALSNIWWRR